jgi:hypothetical protein
MPGLTETQDNALLAMTGPKEVGWINNTSHINSKAGGCKGCLSIIVSRR